MNETRDTGKEGPGSYGFIAWGEGSGGHSHRQGITKAQRTYYLYRIKVEQFFHGRHELWRLLQRRRHLELLLVRETAPLLAKFLGCNL